jgi:hypothetical protein
VLKRRGAIKVMARSTTPITAQIVEIDNSTGWGLVDAGRGQQFRR